uniref:Trafficking protein particle complex subunit n=1 Tax=Panagrolaimus sp. JU765 TaxID=591449 RepID=A0AC34RE66_9BILA
MTLFNFYLFNAKGQCICYKEWKREKAREMPEAEEFRVVFGMIHALRSYIQRVSTKDGQQSIKYFKTSGYKMNYMETITGLKFVLNSDPEAIGIPELLRTIYQIYVETIIKNPLVNTEDVIESKLFHSRLDETIKTHHSFTEA